MSASSSQVACIGQPLSWLVLERLALDELEGAAAATAGEHLVACAACSAAMGTIRVETRVLPALPELPALDAVAPVVLSGGRAKVSPQSKDAPRRWTRWAGVGVALAAAALLLLLLRSGPTEPGGELSQRVRVKGAGIVVMTLVRERDGAVTFDPPDVRETDRWKVQLTCAPGGGASAEIVVLQSGQAAATALAARPFACGNDVVLPGAFRITGGAAIVCAKLTGQDERTPVMACAKLAATAP